MSVSPSVFTSAKRQKIAFVDLNGLIANPIFRLDILEKFFTEYEKASKELSQDRQEWIKNIQQKRRVLGNAVLNDNIRDLIETCVQNVSITDTAIAGFRKDLRAKLKPLLETKVYEEIMCNKITLIDGAEESLKSLRNSGYRIVLLTSQYQHIAEKQTTTLGVNEYFHKICGNKDRNSTDVNKPNPTIAEKEIHEYRATEYLILGDGLKDLLLNGDHDEERTGLADLAKSDCDTTNPGESTKTNKYHTYKIRRGRGISKGKGKAIIIAEELSKELIQCLTVAERNEYDSFSQTGGIGERIGWFPNLTAYLEYKKNNIVATQ